jgi:diguanylate cyclase
MEGRVGAKGQVHTLEQLRPAAHLPDSLVAVFEDINAAVAFFDTDGAMLHANAAMTALGAQSGGTITSLEDLAPGDTTGADFIRFQRFRGGRLDSFHARYDLAGRKGSSIYADLSLQRRALAPGQAPLVIAHLVDVSAERKAQIALERNEVRWETALSAAGQGLWEFNNETQKLSVSRGWRRLRGIDPDEDKLLTREDWLQNVHPEDRDRIETSSQEQGRVDGFDTLEYRERHPDGHYIRIYSRGRPYEFDADGNPLKSIGTDTDITHLKQVEAELALQRERLRVTLQSIADGVI